MGPAAIMGAAGLVGALAGGQKDSSTQNYTKILAPESEFEKQGGAAAGSALTDFSKLINSGPGQQDVTAGTDASRSLAQMLQQFSQGGFMPNQQDYGYAQTMANSVFAPQRTALAQNFQDATMHGNRAAARMGRAGNDPILLNKLLQEHTRQQGMLDSEQTSYMAQRADQMPGQRLGYAQQYAQVQGGLASQALANRQALFAMGSQLRQNEQNFRIGSASTEATSSSGGGLGGMIKGALGGIGMGASVAGAFKSPGDDGAVPASPIAAAAPQMNKAGALTQMMPDDGFGAGGQVMAAPKAPPIFQAQAQQMQAPAAAWQPTYWGGSRRPY